MPSCAEMIQNYSDNVAPTSRRKYTAAVKRFVDFADGEFGRERLLAYIKRLQKERYSPNTIRRYDLTAIRRFYKVNDLPWPLKPWELPSVGEQDIYAPALDAGLIMRLIDTAKRGRVSRQDRALLALSTTYGLRRAEMCGIGPGDIDLERGLLRIHTLKHGRERWHLIPEAIAPYLQVLPFRYLSPTMASKAFYRLEQAAGIPRLKECGWHGIRRALVRGLVQAGVAEPMIRNFLRWKRGTTSDMLLTYFSTQVICADASYIDPGRRDKETDEAVFRVHPFLPMWEEG